MDKLVLNVEDVVNREAFLNGLRDWLDFQEVTANGICRINVDPETDKDEGGVQILNNAPALPGMEIKHGDYNLGKLYGIKKFEP